MVAFEQSTWWVDVALLVMVIGYASHELLDILRWTHAEARVQVWPDCRYRLYLWDPLHLCGRPLPLPRLLHGTVWPCCIDRMARSPRPTAHPPSLRDRKFLRTALLQRDRLAALAESSGVTGGLTGDQPPPPARPTVTYCPYRHNTLHAKVASYTVIRRRRSTLRTAVLPCSVVHWS